MLKIHKPFSKHKLLLIPITSICIAFGFLGLYTLTYTPELSHAESVTYEKTIENITYMQEMAPSICQNMESEKQYQLVDKRDDKTYWIAKLKDGNCWMTQNLDFDIPAEGLSAKDTDISVDWNSSSAYKPVTTQTGSPAGFSTNNGIASYDPGEFVYITPIAQNNCGTVTKLEGCKNWTRVAGLSTSSSNDEQAHYLAGNYYSWAAATAGQAATLTSSTAGEQSTQSICPKGWTLPTSGSNSQYATLVSGLTASTTDTANNLKLAPYYFVYGGYASNSSLYSAGEYGRYWSSTANAASYAYYLGFSASIGPSGSNNRYLGYSVRCVARSESTPDNNVEITVNPTISLDVASETKVEEGVLSESGLDVNVISNRPYSISISSDYPDLTSPSSDVVVPAKGGADLLAGENTEGGWGIKKKTSSDGNGCIDSARSFTAVTVLPQVFCSTGVPGNSKITFPIGVRLPLNIPAGEYSTDITVTVTQN